ncbi:MAG: hypothetical protein ACR2MZ_10910 [Candidatus Dormibacter sp.]|uniref:hypothetical protein n=1 Tax=Candidatus Dormibacter sp. TaxID=2973982 RepID=UPI000DB3D665|nr:MAG: hypothetical protein DLM66_09385 [Candidatus Dormibacteraeota bacterium]
MIPRSPAAGSLQAAIRIGAGWFWLYFASRAWNGVGWMQPLYLAVLVNLACVVGGSGALAGERLKGVPRWLRS